jgi:hypothetical protein
MGAKDEPTPTLKIMFLQFDFSGYLRFHISSGSRKYLRVLESDDFHTYV